MLETLHAGIRGYVLKAKAANDLLGAIRNVQRGSRQVLQLVAEGRTTKEVAETLRVSVKTADSHRTRIMQELEIHAPAGLVRYAVRRGIIEA